MTIVIVFKNGYELRTKCESVEATRSGLTDISYQGVEENKPLYINFDEVLCVYRVVSDELTSDIKDNDGEMTESEAKKEIEHNVFCNTDNFEMTISKECYKTIINALNKQIARKPNKTIDKTCSIQNEVNVCPVCNYYLTQGTDKVSYCEICGQKIDYNE